MNLFEDISDLDEVQTVKQAYLDMDQELEFIPKDGTYALPYVANAAGILYNKDLFEKMAGKFRPPGENLPRNDDEIKQSGTLPLYLGFKDTWMLSGSVECAGSRTYPIRIPAIR